MITLNLPHLRTLQESLMTESCRIVREGVVIDTGIPCRKTSSRLFAEPGDPQDANMRSMAEWGWTMPIDVDVQVGDAVELTDGSLSTIAGEVLQDDTWVIATRVWATRPKTASPTTTVSLYRFNDGVDDYVLVGTFDVQIVYDRISPEETPIRYAQAARTFSKGGWIIGALGFAPQVGDTFNLGPQDYAAVITEVLPFQPQRVEARFTVDTGGPR